MRTSKVHYIAPSAISITPNANNSHRDLAVYVARGAKIKVLCKEIDALKVNPETNTYREWTLAGRNRRLADTTGNVPYTIYARLKKDNPDDAYLVFAAKFKPTGDEWEDSHPYVTQQGIHWPTNVFGDDGGYWWIRLGEVKEAVNGQRTVTLDTGILGTDQYNEEWDLNPDDLPLRVELSCTVNGEDAGPTPYLFWGQSAILAARIVEGWTADASELVHHWTISRRIGNDEVVVASSDSSDSSSSGEEEAWPGNARATLFNRDQTITLYHVNEENDDFLSAPGAVFMVKAYGIDGSSASDSSDSSAYILLGAASINIYVETDALGTKGDSPLSIFRWYKDGLTPVKPVDTSSAEPNAADHIGDGDAYPSTKWNRNAINRPLEGEWALWMCTSTRHGNGIIDAWSDPVRISGANGTTGEDAKDREWIYKRGDTATLPTAPAYTSAQTINMSQTDGNVQAIVESLSEADVAGGDLVIAGTTVYEYNDDNGEYTVVRELSAVADEGAAYYVIEEGSWYVLHNGRWHSLGETLPQTYNGMFIDDYVPDGWYDSAANPNVIFSPQHRFVYACWRDWDKTTKRWGDFQGPTYWGVWGERGIDGDGVQYIYKLFDHELTDAECESNRPDNIEQDENGEWMPVPYSSDSDSSDGDDVNAGWYDDPPSTTPSLPYCYCSTIKYIAGTWGTFSKLGLWSNLSDTNDLDIEFCPYTEDDKPAGVTFTEGLPPEPTDANRHGGSGTNVWFDPIKDAADAESSELPNGKTWSDMVWRAEREMVNGQPKPGAQWVITRIKGEQGEPGGKATSIEKWFHAELTRVSPPPLVFDENGIPTNYSKGQDSTWSATKKYLYCVEKYQLDDGSTFWGEPYFYSEWSEQGPAGDDAHEINPNILLRTIFDKGMDFVKEKWTMTNDNVYIDPIANNTVVNGRKSIRLNAKLNEADVNFKQIILGKLKANTWYTLSFNAYIANGGGALIVSIFNSINGTRTNIFTGNKVKLQDGTEYSVSDNGNNDVVITGGWTGARHSITFQTNSNVSTESLSVNFYQQYRSGTGNHSISCICMPKLEEGEVATAYVAHEDDLKGDAATVYSIIFDDYAATYDTDEQTLNASVTCHVVRTTGSGNPETVTNGTVQMRVDSGSWTQLTNSSGTHTGSISTSPSTAPSTISFRFYLSSGVILATTAIPISVKGATGVGRRGRMYYMAGIFPDKAPYTLTDDLCPVVYYNNDYWYLTAATASSSDIPADGSSKWGKVANFGVALTDAIFVKQFAQFGSGIFTRDWLISTNGTIGGVAYNTTDINNPKMYPPNPPSYPAYQWFDPLFPKGKGESENLLATDAVVANVEKKVPSDIGMEQSYEPCTGNYKLFAGKTYSIKVTMAVSANYSGFLQLAYGDGAGTGVNPGFTTNRTTTSQRTISYTPQETREDFHFNGLIQYNGQVIFSSNLGVFRYNDTNAATFYNDNDYIPLYKRSTNTPESLTGTFQNADSITGWFRYPGDATGSGDLYVTFGYMNERDSSAVLTVTSIVMERSDNTMFVPNYAVDLLTGKSYQNDAYIRGEVHATSGRITGDMIVGTYSDNTNSIVIKPSAQEPSIVGYQGSTEVFGLSSKMYINDSYSSALKLGDSFFRNNGIWIYKNGANGRLTSSQMTVEEVVEEEDETQTHYPAWLEVRNKKIRFGANGENMWPKSRSEVSYGEVYLDGTILKVKTDS